MANYKKFWPSADTYLLQTSPTTPQGANNALAVKSGSGERVSMIKFDLSAIPANATVTAATLTITKRGTGGTGLVNNIHRLVRDWVESEATYNEAETGTNWGTAGAANTTSDYNTTLLDTLTVPAAQNAPETADLTSVVQDWVDGTSNNYGIRISSDGGSGDPNTWNSKEATTKALWPYIEALYTIPQIGYAVNGTTVSAGVRAEWLPLEVGANANGAPRYAAKWYIHRWHIAEMGMSDWLTMHNLRGTALTGITTTNYDTPNVAATYATANLQSVTGRQQGRQMINVMVEFLVDETS